MGTNNLKQHMSCPIYFTSINMQRFQELTAVLPLETVRRIRKAAWAQPVCSTLGDEIPWVGSVPSDAKLISLSSVSFPERQLSLLQILVSLNFLMLTLESQGIIPYEHALINYYLRLWRVILFPGLCKSLEQHLTHFHEHLMAFIFFSKSRFWYRRPRTGAQTSRRTKKGRRTN